MSFSPRSRNFVFEAGSKSHQNTGYWSAFQAEGVGGVETIITCIDASSMTGPAAITLKMSSHLQLGTESAVEIVWLVYAFMYTMYTCFLTVEYTVPPGGWLAYPLLFLSPSFPLLHASLLSSVSFSTFLRHCRSYFDKG